MMMVSNRVDNFEKGAHIITCSVKAARSRAKCCKQTCVLCAAVWQTRYYTSPPRLYFARRVPARQERLREYLPSHFQTWTSPNMWTTYLIRFDDDDDNDDGWWLVIFHSCDKLIFLHRCSRPKCRKITLIRPNISIRYFQTSNRCQTSMKFCGY